MDEGRRADVARWLRKARDDMAVVRLIVERSGPSAVAGFLCQQAAEKLLKGGLVAAGIDPPRTHDLEQLGRDARRSALAIEVDADGLAELAGYAVAPRYPGFPDDQADRDIRRLVSLAESVEAAVVAAIAQL
ncbi:MAG: HEPN domain-containing protein [Myxococcota bacterium]